MPTGVYDHSGRIKARVVVVCVVCGKPREYLASTLRQRRAPAKYCSQACNGAARAKPTTHTMTACRNCGKNFKKRTDHIRENNFCSRVCASEGLKVDGAKWRDPEQIRQYMRAWCKKNREYVNAKSREWGRKNKDKKLANCRARRAKGPMIGADEWAGLLAKFGSKCLRCGATERLEMDHVVPVAKGGTHSLDNLQVLCRTCNASKGARVIDYRRSTEAA
jgi:5-methylcytosine-specific restriction endonuclease McrA